MTTHGLRDATHRRSRALWEWLRAMMCRGARLPLRLWRRLTPGAVYAEARAVLDGHAASTYADKGLAIPNWAWMNALAHRPPSELQALPAEFVGEKWFGATVEIAVELSRLEVAEASSIQSAVFLPAELQALDHREVAPDAIVRAVRRELATNHRRAHRAA